MKREESNYKTSLAISDCIIFFGWVAVIAGIGMTFWILRSIGPNAPTIANFMVIMPGITTVISGLLSVLGGQITKAIIDTADNTRAIVGMMIYKEE